MPWPNQKLTSPISVAKKPKQSRSCTTAEEALDSDANYTEDKGDFEIPPRTSRRNPVRKIPNPSDFKAAFCRRTYCNQKQIGGIFIAKLVVAEKPFVAMSYAKVLGATSRQDGYLEGNGYLVSWCVGHLVELAPPNVYDAKYVKWSIADLPFLPEKWQYLVSASIKKQFGILQKLMHRPDVNSVICATDAGHQGHDHHGAVLQGGYRPPGDSRSGQLHHADQKSRPHRAGVPHLANP